LVKDGIEAPVVIQRATWPASHCDRHAGDVESLMLKASKMGPTSEHDGASEALLLIVTVEGLCEEKWRITETKLSHCRIGDLQGAPHVRSHRVAIVDGGCEAEVFVGAKQNAHSGCRER